MANKRIIELNERTVINMGDYLIVDDATGSRKLAMSTLFNYLTYSSLMFVDTLPTTDIDPTVIYLVPHSGSTTQWDEYIYRDNQWILIGTSTLDLTSIYQTKTDNNLQTTSKQIVGAINEVKSALTANKLGTAVDITSYNSSNNRYTCPSDGYVTVYSADTGVVVTAWIYGSDELVGVGVNAERISGGQDVRDSVYVKKGMKVQAGGTYSGYNTVKFTPITA